MNVSITDRCITNIDRFLKRASGVHTSSSTEKTEDTRLSEQLMRINHAGEVAAQGLYHGQALTTRNAGIKAHLKHAATEEKQHLTWCKERLNELNARTSVLSPAWYAGSFVMGAAAAAAGDDWGLGFVVETEAQVAEHLRKHLELLPKSDQTSRRVLERMLEDEIAHGDDAKALGGRELPSSVKRFMRLSAKVMTATAKWI